MKKINNLKSRITAGLLAIALIFSAITIAPSSKASAEEKQPWFNTEDAAEGSEKVSSLIATMVSNDDQMKKMISMAETAVELMAKQLPAIGTFATPFIKMMGALYSEQNPEITLDDISNQMKSLSTNLENAKNDLIHSMSSANDMAAFVNTFNAFNSSFKEMNQQISHISGWSAYSREQKDFNLAQLIGKREQWMNTDNIVSKLTALGDYLCGDIKLTSEDKVIYDVVMNHYSKTVCFEREAMNQTDRFVADAVAIYLEGTIQLTNCILAARSNMIRNGSDSDLCDAAYCETKIKDIIMQVIKVKEAYAKYQQNANPVIFYDRSEGIQKNITLEAFMGGVGFTGKEPLKDFLPSEKILSEKQMEYIINYAKQHYSEKTIQEFLEYMGFCFNTSSYSKWVDYCNENKGLFNQYLNRSDISSEMREILGYYLNPTEENYRKAGSKNAKGAYIMVDKGYDNTKTHMFGYTSTYYYKGIQLQDANKETKDIAYLYISSGNKECKTDKTMYYLLRK